jgi:chromatin segregation and condensation protein Rec8/ScpA/Scc1 (kleisin family)
MTDKIKNYLADNVTSIIAVIFMLGGVATTITMQQVAIEELKSKVREIEQNKVSYSVLELKEKTLNARLSSIETSHAVLDKRVRRKLDGDVNEMVHSMHDLKVETEVQEQRIKQCESERKDMWGFINKFLGKIR